MRDKENLINYKKYENKIGILGQNILINNKNITAFYILDSLNYSNLNERGVNSHINQLESLFTSLATQKPNFQFSLISVDKTLTPDDIRKNIIDTVRLWDPSYKEIPPMFDRYIEENIEKFIILACKIEIKDMGDIESVSLKNLINNWVTTATQEFFSVKQINIDAKRLLNIEKGLFDIISNYGVRASRELTFYTYISNLYPSYSISYNKNSYIENNISPILGAIHQNFKSRFGYFEMSNVGIELFNLEQRVTYGCVLKIVKFPDIINSDNFNLNLSNLRLNIKTLPKDKARLAIKRTRADLEFEKETAEDARARDTEELDDNLDLAQVALNSISRGKILCEMEASILVLADSIEKLRSEKQRIITTLADIDVICSISLDQSYDYIHNFLKMDPVRFNHLSELRYPLSFQLDSAVAVGDFDSKYTSPAIGIGNL